MLGLAGPSELPRRATMNRIVGWLRRNAAASVLPMKLSIFSPSIDVELTMRMRDTSLN